ncbi:MAG TPA: biotin/lipoyl-binding protein, partial [Gemmataceae bacterium]
MRLCTPLTAALLLAAPLGAQDEPKDRDAPLVFTGVLAPDRVANVGARVPGEITELVVREGDRVKPGQVLFRMDPTAFELEVERVRALVEVARAKLEAAKRGAPPAAAQVAEAQLRRAEAVREMAARQLDRIKRLQGTVPEGALARADAELKQAEAAFAEAQARLAEVRQPSEPAIRIAEAELKRAEAELKMAEYRLVNTSVRAPFGGTVLKAHAGAGDTIRQADAAAVLVLADLDPMLAEFQVPERELSAVRVGQD